MGQSAPAYTDGGGTAVAEREPESLTAEDAGEVPADLVSPADAVVDPANVTEADPEGDGLRNDGQPTTADTPGDVLGI